MKYADLIDFEPIESVIQIHEADSHDKARQLVETFVISERTAEQLVNLLVPHLQFEHPTDNKGVLIIGNYGTGKSHLMSFISALAEHADLVDAVRNPAVVQAVRPIVGKFKVIRSEIGSTRMSLRDIVCEELVEHLSDMGVPFTFPPAGKVRNNKDALTAMMSKFHQQYPHQGLLMLVDELLDYLRTRNEQELILDLNFLREVGEVCSSLRLRFLAGLQESLFDNPRFQFVADSVRRLQARFEQLRIVRQDVAFVVSERLLTKNAEQQAWIREHLETFTPLYDAMVERLDEFVRLFPIHPAYLDSFELISIAEKREILKTLSAEMRRLLDQNVPDDEPGLISYDSYWGDLRDNASIRSIPDVREVIDKSNVLENRIKQAFTRKTYTPMALRISHGLSVHRLTTGDIYAKIGPTASELRDDLCLLHTALPEKTSDFLRTTVESCMNEIVKTMSGQFITHNTENDQYYLDLEKNLDYDTEIEKRAESLSGGELDRYYFDALKRVLACEDRTYVTGYRIWEHEVEWRGHKVTRRGYLFFGAPNERSTSQPPRDFYLNFIQPFQPTKYKDEELADEVFFMLKRRDEHFNRALSLYAGAMAMASQASRATRKAYEDKADQHVRSLTNWLRQHMLTAFDVVHQGVSKQMVDVLKGHRTRDMTVREIVNLVGSVALGPCFEERYPEYPGFSVLLTSSNMADAVADAIRCLAGGLRSHLATAVLDGLELLDGDKIRPHDSRYAKAVLTGLESKPQGQVLNRTEIITTRNDVEFESNYKLEPELLGVVLLALVYSGDISLNLVGNKKIDAATLTEAGKTSVDEFIKFRHVERPKDIPLAALVALFELMGLSEGLIRDPNTREEAIKLLHHKTGTIVNRVVVAKQYVQSGLPCWRHELIPLAKRAAYRSQLDDLQNFLERLQAFTSAGNLKNVPYTVEEVQAHSHNLSALAELEAMHNLVTDLTPIALYLTAAEAVLAGDDAWVKQVDLLRYEWWPQLLDPSKRSAPGFRLHILHAMEDCRQAYQEHYLTLHKKTRLSMHEDERKRALLNDVRLNRLKKLTIISLLPRTSLTDLQNRLANLVPCYTLVKDDLVAYPICPHCDFRPRDEVRTASVAAVLDHIDNEIDLLLNNWTGTLLSNLADPTAEQSINLLDPDQKLAVMQFLDHKELPESVDDALVEGLQNALSGLTPLAVKPMDMLTALGDGKTPCTVEQLRSRFEDFVQNTIRGKDVSKIRIILEKKGR